MITVSYLNWQYNYWIDLSERKAEVFEITMQEFSDIQNWLAYIENKEVIYKVKSEEEIKAEKKEELLFKINSLQEQSLAKRLEYTTIRDMLPEWNPIREMKLQKLAYEWDEILVEFETLVKELVTEFGENALIDII